MLYVERLGGDPLDPQIAASCRRAVQRFAALGHQVDDGALPLDLDFIIEAWPQIGQIGLAAMFDAAPRMGSPGQREVPRDGGRTAAACRRPRCGTSWSGDAAAPRRAALFERSRPDRDARGGGAALAGGEAYPPVIDGQDVGPRGHAVYTGWVNAAGLPGLALPAAPSPEGLPIGMQLIGAYGSDDLLLDLGAAFEAVAPWADRWPAL